jgi:hypothetical protein
MYAFLKKCYRKADHLPQPFLGSTSLYEPCMYRRADSCTLALYEPIMKAVQASTNAVPQEITVLMYVRVHTCSDHVYTMYIHGMYNVTSQNTKGNLMQSSSFEPTIVCRTASCLNHFAQHACKLYNSHSICILLSS